MNNFQNIKTSKDRFYDLDLFSWTIGIIEGDGSIMISRSKRQVTTRISIQMTDKDTIARLAEYWGMAYWKQKRHKSKMDHHKDVYMVKIVGKKAESFLCNAYPYFGERRQSKIREVLGYTPEPNPEVKFSEWSWFIGIMEAEGCLALYNKVPTIMLSSSDSDIVERCNAIIKSPSVKLDSRKKKPHHKILYCLDNHSTYSKRLMRRMQPFMSKRRQEKIQEIMLILDNSKTRKGKLSPFQVRNIKEYFRDNGYKIGMDSIIAKQYNVSASMINLIRNEKSHMHIKI